MPEIVQFRPSGNHEWTRWAECAKPGAPYMFPREQDERAIEAARGACDVCPVRQECLTEALNNGENHGVWGGLTSEERRSVARTARRHKLPLKVVAGRALEDVDVRALDAL